MLAVLNDVMDKVIVAYKEYRFSDITGMLTNVMTNELSAYYLDYTKDILYIEKANDVRRRQVQTVLWHAVDVLVRLWAPILVHTCEEVNDFLHSEEESIHLGTFPTNFEVEDAVVIKEKMAVLFEVRNDVLKALEEARTEKVIGKSLEAHVTLNVDDTTKALIDEVLGNKLNQWLIVSKVSFTNDTLKTYNKVQVKVEKCDGVVCPRCWNITDSTHEEGLCERCQNVLK